MQTTEPPTKVYEPKPKNQERIAQLAQSNAPIRVYTPQSEGSVNGVK